MNLCTYIIDFLYFELIYEHIRISSGDVRTARAKKRLTLSDWVRIMIVVVWMERVCGKNAQNQGCRAVD